VSDVKISAPEVEKPAEFAFAPAGPARGLLARIGRWRKPLVTPPIEIPAPTLGPTQRMSAYLVTFVAFVIAPAIAASLYFAFLASDQYVAETRFAVSSVFADAISKGGTNASPMGFISAANDDSYLVAAYIRSRACIAEISRGLNLREIFRRPEADFWARLKSDASSEELTKYWQQMVTAYVDPPSGIVTVTVSAFRREDALAVASAILKASESVANDVSTRARADVMKLADQEVKGAEDRVANSLTELRAFREDAGFIDPKMQAETTGNLLQELITQRMHLQTEFAVSSRAMSPEAPTLQSMKGRIDQLDVQIANEKAELTSRSHNSQALANLIPRYEELIVRSNFAEKLYELAADGLERARLRAVAQTIYVNVFVPPALPEDPLYPERIASAVTVSLALLILWGIGALVAALVEDHKL
jgi:capsular polysaccharide transport system permease protein